MIQLTTMIRLNEKHTRATTKHDWTGYTLDDMHQALSGELLELGLATKRDQIHGHHGVIDEAYDTIAVLLRMVETLEAFPDGRTA